MRAPRPHNHETPAGQAEHHAVGMKSELSAAQVHRTLSRSPDGAQAGSAAAVADQRERQVDLECSGPSRLHRWGAKRGAIIGRRGTA
jgi:hypothetical protein